MSDVLGISVVSVGSTHLAQLAALFERNSGFVAGSFDPFPLTLAEAERIATQPRADEYFLAHAHGLALAMSMLRGFDEGYAIPSFGIFVDHEHQGDGIGRHLTSWTIAHAWRSGYPAVRLSVYASNTRALGLYESLGFEEVRRERDASCAGRADKIVMLLQGATQR